MKPLSRDPAMLYIFRVTAAPSNCLQILGICYSI
jgi:hypothetical protein